ncbi:hypothetical protein JCM10207_004429 [Rhodosporidiobolus poonsookiae]
MAALSPPPAATFESLPLSPSFSLDTPEEPPPSAFVAGFKRFFQGASSSPDEHRLPPPAGEGQRERKRDFSPTTTRRTGASTADTPHGSTGLGAKVKETLKLGRGSGSGSAAERSRSASRGREASGPLPPPLPRATQRTRDPTADTSASTSTPPPVHAAGGGGVGGGAGHVFLSNGKRYVRPVRLSGAAPSVRISLQHAETAGAAGPTSSAASDYRFPLTGGGGAGGGGWGTPHAGYHAGLGGSEDSPTLSTSEGFDDSGAARMGRRRRYSFQTTEGVRGLQLTRVGTAEDDTRSVVSVAMSQKARGTAAMESMRRMHGSVNSRRHWIADESVSECMSCQARFGFMKRKHHCRICGRIFCAACTPYNRGEGRSCVECHISREKRQASRSNFDDAASLSLSYTYRGTPGPPPAGGLSTSPYTPGFSRPPSLYHSQSYLRRPVTPGEDHISERSSRPQTPVSEEDDAAGGQGDEAEPPARASPKSSLRKKLEQQQLAQQHAAGAVAPSETSTAGLAAAPVPMSESGATGSSLSALDEVQSPTLSAVPFRKDVNDEDEHSTHGGDEHDEEEERDGEADGLGISVGEGEGEAKGLGLDLGEGLELDAPAAPPPPPPPTARETSFSTPANPSPRPGSALLTDFPVPRHSPSVPGFDRSISRLSILGANGAGGLGSGITLLPFDVSPTDPDAWHRDAFEVADEIPLSPAALEHIRRMIRQSLQREGVPHAKAWAKELERLLLSVADRLSSLPHRAVGDDLDVRHYVRVKRIPGGRPRDSEFVSGVVITKNLMHKEMPREMTNAKVMLLSIPLDYELDNKMYSLQAMLQGGNDTVDKLVYRIHAHFPDLVLVGHNVSQHALKVLREKNISAARNIKPTALEAVARALGAEVVTSQSDLYTAADWSSYRFVQRCASFRVQTFVHRLIPGGRKTILRFEGEDSHKPCTVLLRGESLETLTKVKRIFNMLVLVVYNAKLEGYLLHDQRIELLPAAPKSTTPSPAKPAAADGPASLFSPTSQQHDSTTNEISTTLAPYEAAALSGSALVHYPPPYPLARMAAADQKIREMRDQRESEETQRIIEEEAASRAQSVSGGSVHNLSLLSPVISPSPSPSPSAAMPSSPQEAPPPLLLPLPSIITDFSSALSRRPSREVIQHPHELVKQTAFTEAEERHKQYLAAWDAYRKANQDSFDPVDHQQLFVLESLILVDKVSEPNRLCRPPEVHSISFYGENDRTIGAFLRDADIAQRTSEPCPSPSCHEALARHQRVYVHDGFVVRIGAEPYNNDVLRGGVGMSAECRREGCSCGGRLTLVSNETSRLSFGKFLELAFYPSEQLVCADDACGHDGLLEHVRFWHFGSVRVSIRMDRIDLRDVVPPPRHVRVRPDRQLELRNAEYDQVRRRSEAFFDSVQTRIIAFKLDCVAVDRIEECKAALADFSAKCEQDRKAIARLLKSTYEHAQSSNGTEMTVVRRALQEKSHAFDADWTAFAKRIMPADVSDMRRVSASQLKRLFPEAAAGLAVSPGRRTTPSNLPPALEIDEHAEGSESPLSTSSETSSLMPCESASADGDASSILSAEVQIDPPQLSLAETSVDPSLDSSTSTLEPVVEHVPLATPSLVIPEASPGAVERSTSLPLPRSPRLSRSPTFKRRSIEESDLDSDSTVCADGDAAPSAPRTSSPFIRRHFPPAPVDETSAAESELEHPIWQRRKAGHHVAGLVDAFESASSLGRSGSGKKHSGSPARPGMRRAHTEKTGSMKSRSRPGPVLSDDNSYARNVGVSHLMDQQLSAAAARPTRIPRKPQPIKTNSLTGVFDPLDSLAPPDEPESVMGLGLSLSPTSSRPPSRGSSRPPSRGSFRPFSSRPSSPTASRNRPPAGDESASSAAGRGSSRPPLKSYSSSRSTIKGKTRAIQSESSDAGRPLLPTVPRNSSVARPTASSASKITSRRVVSTGNGRHVSNMRRHWDSLAAAAEKRQSLRKRARPIITSQPTLQVFDNIRDAIKEDSDDEHEASSSAGESDGADDEFDDDHEAPEQDEDGEPTSKKSPLALQRETTLRPPEPITASREPAATSSMADALVRSVSVAKLDPSSMLPPPPPQHEHLSRSVEPSDSEYPSVPPSPLLPDSFTFPRMSEGESSGAERKSIFNAFSSLWTYRNGDFSPLAYPTLATEHVYADNPVVLRDDEPTSIIAHALSSKKYYQAFETIDLPRIREGLTANKAESIKGDTASLDSPDPELAKTIEDILRAGTQRAFKLGDVELGDISARCTVFWVEQFEALRRQCGCDTQFIESLSRCFKWDAVGGKSKVDFMKTLDDRFIVKQLSRPEMEVFARFAPAYFQYMADALFQGKPTVLAKVFGIYRISLGKHYRNVDFLVMENLFYGHQLKQIFDLKGSTRNRRAEENNPVLLDENLLEISLKNPFYVREESKQYIKQAIYNDSQFLSDLNVMDYSLVVGVDAVNAELCVGIVDYIRTYTWDKRIESWVKETTFLGGASKAGGPTVITPPQYKSRFREAIDGYLLLSPTPWLNPRSLLPVTADPRSKTYFATAAAAAPVAAHDKDRDRDTASILSSGRNAVGAPSTPASMHVPAFTAPALG